MKKISIVVCMFMFLVSAAHAAIRMNVGPSFNMFSDSRIQGMSTFCEIGYEFNSMFAGYKIEQSSLKYTDANGSESTFGISSQANLLTLTKSMSVVNDVPVYCGVELGSVVLSALTGTGNYFGGVGVPATINQSQPVAGIFGGVSMQGDNKGFNPFLNLSMGYRFVSINGISSIGWPGSLSVGEKTLSNLNAFKIEISVGASF